MLSALAVAANMACQAQDSDEMDDTKAAPEDIVALVWCVLSDGIGQTADGETVDVDTTSENRGACLCLPVGVQPYTGSELDEILHQMALDKCEEDLAELGAVTTDCAEYIPDRSVGYETTCDPDEWPTPPI